MEEAILSVAVSCRPKPPARWRQKYRLKGIIKQRRNHGWVCHSTSSALTQTVSKAATTTALSSAPNPADGQPECHSDCNRDVGIRINRAYRQGIVYERQAGIGDGGTER